MLDSGSDHPAAGRRSSAPADKGAPVTARSTPRTTPLEIEAKLLVGSESALARIASLRRLGRYHLRPVDAARLYSVYLDTARFRLARHGIALRLRRKHRRWEVTAKWGGKVEGAVHERPEETVPLAGAPESPFRIPPGPLRRRLGPLVGRNPLRAVLVTLIHRRILHVSDTVPDGRVQPIAELALDRVGLRRPGDDRSRVTYREVEIELLHGRRPQLAEMVRLLAEHVELAPSPESKFARGMALLYPGLVIGEESTRLTR